MSVEKGRNYFWCSCGKSKNQPFCDMSQKEQILNQLNIPEESKTVYFCHCKQTNNQIL